MFNPTLMSPLSKLVNLQELSISCYIEHLKVLEPLVHLREISLWSYTLEVLYSLHLFPKLHSFYVGNTIAKKIEYIPPDKVVPSVKYLALRQVSQLGL